MPLKFFGGVDTDINNTNRRMSDFDSTKDKPSEFDAGTTVHWLTNDLMKYIRQNE